jgi:hypothetical protein
VAKISGGQDSWSALWLRLGSLSTALSRISAVNVNTTSARDLAREIAQQWFRSGRPELLSSGVPEGDLHLIDSGLQYLLRLSLGRNAKKSYTATIRELRRVRTELEGRLELRRGAIAIANQIQPLAPTEDAILSTLDKLLPVAASSYRQVLEDLAAPKRHSYRGTATELREVVREVLDHMAPDEEVTKSPGFKLEKDRKGPTMKQKARFILRVRGVGDTSRKAPEDAVNLLEEQVAGIARSVYERGSVSTHAAPLREQVLSFKSYADAVLAELLQIHYRPNSHA